MRILITNDDGIDAKGIRALAERLSKRHEILIVAPMTNKSACSHSITIFKEMKLVERKDFAPARTYALDGTPADCVKFAVFHFSDFKPDLLVSGINHGSNLGTDIFYSGTVSAATEASYLKIPAIAVSCVGVEEFHFDACAEIAEKLVDSLAPHHQPDLIWNVNIPNLPIEEIRGIRIAKNGIQIYNDVYTETRNEAGEVFYSLGGEPITHDENDAFCDVELVRAGYAAVSPLRCDRNCYQTIEKLKELF